MKRIFLTSILLCVALGAIPPVRTHVCELASYLISFAFERNFHEVIPGQLYRSAQMPRDELSRTVREHHIKTVVDLRLQDDYVDSSGRTEAQAAAEGGSSYVHIPLSSKSAMQLPQLMKLVETFDKAKRPVLIHCSDGTHRSGVASAIWLLEEGDSAVRAKEQLGLRYGFLGIERKLKELISGHPTLDFVLSDYFAVGATGGCSFRKWLENSAKMTSINQWECPVGSS